MRRETIIESTDLDIAEIHVVAMKILKIKRDVVGLVSVKVVCSSRKGIAHLIPETIVSIHSTMYS
jgi:hypothetical protein